MKRTEIMAREPHYADMMETWSTIVTVLYFYLVVVMGITDFVTANAGSLMLCLITSAFMLGVMWLPGLIVIAFMEKCYERLASLKPVYAHSRSIFTDGLRGLKQMRIDVVNGTAFVFMGVLVGLAIIMSIVGIVLGQTGIDIAIYSGGILAWLGAIIVSLRLLCDAVIEKCKIRWVF